MEKEYYLDRDIKRQVLISALIIIGLREILDLILILWGGHIDILSYILLLIGAISAGYLAVSSYTEKIIVSAAGVTFKRLGLSYQIKWEDIERVGRKRILGVSYQGIFAPKNKVK